jgi:hypothetical protein
VLMGNHYHLLLETPRSNLSSGMHRINAVYSQKFNQCHERVGHVLQGRFKAILVEKERHLLELVRYVVLNPVRAGLVGEAGQWRWSNLSVYCGIRAGAPLARRRLDDLSVRDRSPGTDRIPGVCQCGKRKARRALEEGDGAAVSGRRRVSPANALSPFRGKTRARDLA